MSLENETQEVTQDSAQEPVIVIRNANEESTVENWNDHGQNSPQQQPEEAVVQEEEIAPTQEPVIEPVVQEFEYDDNKIFEILKAKTGREIKDYSDLSPKDEKELPPEVEKFLEFQKETGNYNYSDFLETQKDWSKEDPESVIKRNMALENPALSKDEIDFLFNRKYSLSDLDEDEDNDEIMSRNIDKKVALQSALSKLEAQKEKYKVVGDAYVPQEYKEARVFKQQYLEQLENDRKAGEALRGEFVRETENIFSNNFDGFKVNIEGKDYSIKPTDINTAKTEHLDSSKFTQKFFDETGKLKDPAGYHKSYYAAMNTDAFAKHFFNLGKAAFAEQDDRESKNITVDQNTNMPPHGQSQITIKRA